MSLVTICFSLLYEILNFATVVELTTVAKLSNFKQDEIL